VFGFRGLGCGYAQPGGQHEGGQAFQNAVQPDW